MSVHGNATTPAPAAAACGAGARCPPEARHREAFYALVRGNPFGIAVVGADFRVRELSAGARRTLAGIEPLIGRDLAELQRLLWAEPLASQVIAHMRHTLDTGEPYVAPRTVQPRRDSGEAQSFDWRVERVTLPEGDQGIVVFFYDLSERMAWEAALRESEQRLRRLADSVPALVWISDASGTVTFLNRRWYDYTGQAPGQDWMEALHPDDLAAVSAEMAQGLAAGRMQQAELRYRRHDGQWRWHLARSEPQHDAQGRVSAWFGSAVDVHEQHLAREHAASLLALEEGLRAAADPRAAASAACAVLGRALRAHGVSLGELQDGGALLCVDSEWRAGPGPSLRGRHRVDAAEEHFARLRAGQVVRAADLSRDPRSATDPVAQAVLGVLGPRAALELPLLRQGRLRAVLLVVTAAPHDWNEAEVRLAREALERSWQAMEQLRSEQVQREHEAYLAAIYAQSGAGLAQVDLSGRIVDANERYCAIVGRSRAELLRLRMQDITHPDDLPMHQRLFQRLVDSGEPFSIEKRYLRPDGSTVWIANSVDLIRVPGAPPRVLAVTIDITARKQAEQRLREAQALHDLAAEAGCTGTWCIDLASGACTVSPSMARLMGLPPQQLTVPAGWWQDWVLPEDQDRVQAAMDAAVARGKPYELELRLRTGPGSDARWFHSRGEVVRDAGGQPVQLLGASVDVSRYKAAQAALGEALQAKDALLYEVNHRVKNNLQVISSLLSLQARTVRDPDARAAIAEAQARVAVVSRLHQQLYQSGTHAGLDYGPYLQRLAADTLASLGGGRRLRLVFEARGDNRLAPDLAVPLSLAVSELITNAVKYAFPDDRAGTLRLRLAREAGQLEVLVADDGVGLPPGFDPATSTGLGMRIVQALLGQLQGRLERPVTPHGTAFRILVPLGGWA
ncbi:PAS domain S-box protein [Azohydromonas caseinilytica]|uniref:histidine kinase n=1 Tax=Azohydromonas caseinilytica TaxID=2728836 RepID=A0A848FA64_9BURK|nr:PAS domain S-box protein [Azohydromonas caseinilytica]NML15645.1 PAS domain S-box protein [Azohydromonas caseinilytica]